MTKLLDFKLRAHHNLCIQFFSGKGYSADFVREMTKIIEFLNISDPEITLAEKCDIICKACPNKIDGKCVSEQKVCAIDRRCMKACGLQCGDKIRWSELKNLAYSRVIEKNKISEVCGNCEWAELCQFNTEIHKK